jgi:hypothetical protein
MVPMETYRQYDINSIQLGSAEEEGEQGADCSSPSPGMEESEIIAIFNHVHESNTSHFFVNVEGSDPGPAEDIVVFESNDFDPYSITQFLQLPTVTARVNSIWGDLIIDYTKSIILSSS